MPKVPAWGPRDAEILIVGEAPGADEEKIGQPFVGVSGQELTRMLAEAGIARGRCRLANVTGWRPEGNDITNFMPKSAAQGKAKGFESWHGVYYSSEIAEGLKDLQALIIEMQPKMIIALGGTALWALTGETAITSWRGSMMQIDEKAPIFSPDVPICRVMPTLHPELVLRQWTWRSIAVHDLRKAQKGTMNDWWPERDYQFSTNPTLPEVLTYLADLRAAKRPFACDIETTGRNISLIALGNSVDNAMCIPLMTKYTEDNCYWSRDDEQAIVEALRALMQDPECGVIGQNFHYDTQFFLRHLGIYAHIADDTMWMQHVAFPGQKKSLDFLASMYGSPYCYWKDELKDYRRLPDDEEKFKLYNCKDVCYTYEVWQNLKQIVEKMGLGEQYRFQLSLFHPVLDMMVRGVRVDSQQRAALRKRIGDRKAVLEKFFREIVGDRVGSGPKTSEWFRSPQQMIKLFYGEMGIKPILNRKTQKPTVDEEALVKIAAQKPGLTLLCEYLAEYSSLDTFSSTFLEAKVDEDGRMRCSYNVSGTETFRFSSSQNVFGSGLNLQNIPRSSDLNVRGMFVPDPGHVILDFDLSSADLRVVIKESGARKLQAIIDAGEDVYGTLAARRTNTPYQGKKHPDRQTMKTVAHALDYVGGVNTISANTGLPRSEIDALKKWYFKENPEIPQWHTSIDRDLRTTRRVKNRWGFQRIYFDRLETLLTQATAWVGQSTVAITINKGLLRIAIELLWVQLLLQVHDSVVVQIPESMCTLENIQRIKECLLVEIPYKIPLVIPVDCKMSSVSWGECISPEKFFEQT
jgi:DNA polymerase I-like protein with 3'-5' exonuclease and polymerase domains/uracil-DNA glycosylase